MVDGAPGAEVSVLRRDLITPSHRSVRPSSIQRHALTAPPTGGPGLAPADNARPLEILAVSIDANQSTVEAMGDLDLATAGQLAKALAHEFQQGRRFVRLDLSHLSFMDCAGLRVVVGAHYRFHAAGGAIALTGLRAQPKRLLAITRLDETLFIADGPTESVRARHLVAVRNRTSRRGGEPS